MSDKGTKRLWSVKETNTLREMAKQQKSAREIGAFIGRTKKAVVSKARRENIFFTFPDGSLIKVAPKTMNPGRRIIRIPQKSAIGAYISEAEKARQILESVTASQTFLKKQMMETLGNNGIAEIRRVLEGIGRPLVQLVESEELKKFLSEINSMRSNIITFHQEWVSVINQYGIALQKFQEQLTQPLLEYAQLFAFIHASIPKIDARNFSTGPHGLTMTIRHVQQLEVSYSNLVEAVKTPNDFVKYPPFALVGASNEMCLSTQALNSMVEASPEVQEFDETPCTMLWLGGTEQVISCLTEINPALAPLYKGALEALQGSCIDKTRHVYISLRELLRHLLEMVAPTEVVDEWFRRDERSFLWDKKGQPTRRARIHYLCRNMPDDRFTVFVDDDAETYKALIETLNEVHEITIPAGDRYLRYLLIKTDAFIFYLYRLWNDLQG